MSLLKQLMKESATSAGGVANSRGSLFGGGDEKENKKNATKMLQRLGFIDLSEIPSKANRKKWMKMIESTAYGSDMKPYDYNDVLSKLDQAVKTAHGAENVAVYGIEDDEGKIVKVYVNKEQGDEFEAALSELLAGESDMSPTGEFEAVSAKDIAEIIYDLKGKFDIIDADWGEIQGTEEEEDADITADSELEDGELEGDEDLEGGLEGEDSVDGETEEKAMTALQAVISTLQSDAEAKKAEAEARQKEAERDIAKSAADAAMAKVQQEEDILDMDNAEKAKKDAKKEAETLAKLVRYRKEMDADANAASDEVSDDDIDDFANSKFDGSEDDDMELPNEEEEEMEKEEITKDKLIELIYKNLTANG